MKITLTLGSIILFCVATMTFVPSQLSAAGRATAARSDCFAICKDSYCEKSGAICTCSCKDGQAVCSCGTPAE